MARAVDADVLKEVLERNFGHTGGAEVLMQLIDAQPTIEPSLNWISIQEDLPKPGQSLLCAGRQGGLFVVKRLRAEDIKAEGRIWSYGSGWRWFTHWMELPKLPGADD